MERCVDALKRWTGKSKPTIIFDSTVDEFTNDCLFQKVRGKPNVAIVATTTDGDVFGGFYSVAVTERLKDENLFDPNMFAFSFESHGRCETPKRFAVKKKFKVDAGVAFFFKNDSDMPFVEFYGGGGEFFLGNEKTETWCYNLSDCFKNVENTTLTGKNCGRPSCCRFVVSQLE